MEERYRQHLTGRRLVIATQVVAEVRFGALRAGWGTRRTEAQRVRWEHRATTTRSGNPWLTSALVEAAWSASRTKNCYLGVRFWRIAKRRGQQRALIAIAHTLLIICWHLLHDETTFNELRTAYLEGKDQPERRRRLLVGQLEQLGWNVELTPAA